MLDRPGHIRGGVEDAHWSGGDQLASTEDTREVAIILEGGLALDCPEGPDECVGIHPRAASAMQSSLTRVRYSAALESRSAWWRASCESEANAIGFCWLLLLAMGKGEDLEWVRKRAKQTRQSRTRSFAGVWPKSRPRQAFLEAASCVGRRRRRVDFDRG
jgi:hypothetical protein